MSISKNTYVAILSLLLPAFLFLNVWQGYRHERIFREIEKREIEQKEWFEENKKMLAALSVYSSPGRVEKIIEENSDLKTAVPGQLIVVKFVAEAESLESE